MSFKIPAANSQDQTYDKPPLGTHQAVICDIIDLGIIDRTRQDGSEYQRQEFKINFQIEALKPDGYCYEVSTWGLPVTLNDASNTYKVLKGILGREIDPDEEFELEDLLGVNCMINIIERPGKRDPKKMIVEIGNYFPLMKNMKPIEVTRYVRRQDRPAKDDKAQGSQPAGKPNGGTPKKAEGNNQPSAAQLTALFEKLKRQINGCQDFDTYSNLWDSDKFQKELAMLPEAGRNKIETIAATKSESLSSLGLDDEEESDQALPWD